MIILTKYLSPVFHISYLSLLYTCILSLANFEKYENRTSRKRNNRAYLKSVLATIYNVNNKLIINLTPYSKASDNCIDHVLTQTWIIHINFQVHIFSKLLLSRLIYNLKYFLYISYIHLISVFTHPQFLRI